jgi:ppGpp synthetase/RelA/SpoT-type nucleotidyltranferase
MKNDEIVREFQRRGPLYQSLNEEVLYILKAGLSGSGIKLHSIPSRIKDIGSFLDKSKRKQTEKPFEDIQDIVGVRVVCLFLSDIDRLGN